MPHDAIKQGLREVLSENVDVLLEPWNVFYEVLNAHISDGDKSAIYLLKDLYDSYDGFEPFHDALGMEGDEQQEALENLIINRQYNFSEEDGRLLLDILTYAARVAEPSDVSRNIIQKSLEKSEADLSCMALEGTQSDKQPCEVSENVSEGINTEEEIWADITSEYNFMTEAIDAREDTDFEEQLDDEVDDEQEPVAGEVLDKRGAANEESFPDGAYTLESEKESLTAYRGLLLKRDDEGLPVLNLPLHIALTGESEADRREAAESLARHACELGFLDGDTLYEGDAPASDTSVMWYIRLAELEAYDLNRISSEMEKTDFIAVISGTQKELMHAFKLCPSLSFGYVHQVHIKGDEVFGDNINTLSYDDEEDSYAAGLIFNG